MKNVNTSTIDLYDRSGRFYTRTEKLNVCTDGRDICMKQLNGCMRRMNTCTVDLNGCMNKLKSCTAGMNRARKVFIISLYVVCSLIHQGFRVLTPFSSSN